MDYNEQKDIPNLEYDKGNLSNDYKFLVQKLRSIKNIIKTLEKNFLEKEI